MINPTHVHTDNDFAPVTTSTINLSAISVEWATRICQEMDDVDEQWQVFLRALAIAGFDQWLNDGATSLAITYSKEIPPRQGINMKVADFNICILAIGGLSEAEIEIPIASRATEMAHLYVLIEVQEEIDQVCIWAGLRTEQLLQWSRQTQDHLKDRNYTLSAKQIVNIPISEFQISPEQILLYLNCLEPTAANAMNVSESEGHVALTLPIIKAGQWLKNQLDDVSKDLSWIFLPPMRLASGMRSSSVDNHIEQIIQGLSLPVQARGVRGSITIDQFNFQIYAWSWIEETVNSPAWNLLLLLGPQSNSTLPVGTRIEVSDQNDVLATEILGKSAEQTYLYSQVQGTRSETFKVRIIFPNGSEAVLPEFGFE